MGESYDFAGVAPNDLVSHTVSKQYNILGITPDEFVTRHGSAEFDLDKLKKHFKTICTDYGDQLVAGTKSHAVEFCSKVIYEIEPDSRKRNSKKDKIWKLRFCYESLGELVVSTLFIATYRNSEYKENFTSGKTMCLTVKQAGLIAMDTFLKISSYAITLAEPIHLLTPLAGTVFSRNDISSLAVELGATETSVLAAINASCQSGGQYLDQSKPHIAAILAIVATKNIKNQSTRDGIIAKTVKQYLSLNKNWNDVKFEIYAKYAHGGVPSTLSPTAQIDNFERIQTLTSRQSVSLSHQTQQTSTVSVPPSGQQAAGGSGTQKKKTTTK